jgi:hypothetical protein
MNFKNLKNTQELQNFVEEIPAIAYSVSGDKADRYSFIQTTGYSRQQLTRLNQQYIQAGIIQPGESIKRQDLSRNTVTRILSC